MDDPTKPGPSHKLAAPIEKIARRSELPAASRQLPLGADDEPASEPDRHRA